MFGIKKFLGKKYVGLASLMVGPTILQANKSDGPAVIVLIFEPWLCKWIPYWIDDIINNKNLLILLTTCTQVIFLTTARFRGG